MLLGLGRQFGKWPREVRAEGASLLRLLLIEKLGTPPEAARE
jgi:hypothetical protein